MRRSLVDSYLGLASLVLIATLSTNASAVIISAGDGTGNTILPAANPGAGNVAHLSSASAVYLGNRWVITANHVTDSTSVTLADGRSIAIVPGSAQTLNNPTGFTGTPDLRLEQLATDPGLPSLDIPTQAAGAGNYVMMIGNGFDRKANLIGFQLQSTGYVAEPLPVDSLFGHEIATTSHLGWGFNLVEAGGVTTMFNTQTIHTIFNRATTPNEAQATSGDSGGGVFQLTGGEWKLAGIMIATQGVSGQPLGTVVYGDQTIIADLATYRDQIEAIIHPTAQPAASTLTLSSPLTAANALSIAPDPTAARSLLAPDALAASQFASPFAVPEPSSLVLAVGAALAALGARFFRRRAVR